MKLNQIHLSPDPADGGAPKPEAKAEAAAEKKLKVKTKTFVMINGKGYDADSELHVTKQEYLAHSINLVKLCVAFLLTLAVFLAAPAHAQQYTVVPITAGITNLDGGNSTNNTVAAASAVSFTTTNAYVTLTKYDGTSISLNAKLMASGTSAITAVFDASNDATNWNTSYLVLSVNANGTTAVGTGTNLVNQHWGYLRLNYITNASNATLTNIAILYSRKPGRTGN